MQHQHIRLHNVCSHTLVLYQNTLVKCSLLNRVRPSINPRLDESLSGCERGADIQAYALLETFCAFLDIRRAFDVAWRDAAMLRLHRAGVSDDMWYPIDDIISNRTAAVRIQWHASDLWDVGDGIGHGAMLSGLLITIKRACKMEFPAAQQLILPG